MSTNFVQNQYAGTREQRGAVWLTAHGSNEIHSVSVATYPEGGTVANLFRQILEGTVLAKRSDSGLHYPNALDSAQSAVVASAGVVVADPLQFQIGQYVEFPSLGAGDATDYRKVTAIDYDTNAITFDAAVTLDEGDALEVDGGRSFGVAVGGATSATVQLGSGEASRFQAGDAVHVGADAGTVLSVDTGADTITLTGSITYVDGDLVVSASDGIYKISEKTVTIDDLNFSPQNVLVPTRPHGRVKEALVIGLTAEAKTALEGLIIFDSRTIA